VVKATLTDPGRPLDPDTRRALERRLSFDFRAVRIHDDSRARDSARAIGARAYAFGQHVVLDMGGMGPTSTDTRRALVHELTHVAQRGGSAASSAPPLRLSSVDEPAEREAASAAHGATPLAGPRTTADPGVVYRWESCGAADECPRRDPGEVTAAASGGLQVGTLNTTDFIVYGFPVGSASTRTLSANPGWAPFWGSLVTGRTRFAILGFSDCEGATELNTELRWTRAMNVNNALPTAARANIDGFRAAPLSDCVAGNDSAPARRFNRAVVFQQTVSSVDFPDDQITVRACPPTSPRTAANLDEYRGLVMCAERTMGLGPRDMLAVLRQLYYGKQWSSVSTTDKWDNVIPCSPAIGNPEARLGSNLFHALRDRDEVGGVDVGHVWTGLEAMTCPSSSVPLLGGLASVSMSNEDFATWGGDLGAAVAGYVACPQMGSDASTEADCGHSAGTHPLAFYLTVSAPAQDLEGDIAGFVVRSQALGIPCATSARASYTPTRPMSEVLFDYFSDPSSALGRAADNRYHCFVQSIGGTVSGRRITNWSTIRGPIAHRVKSFADAFYTKIRGLPHTTDAGDRTVMSIQADLAVDWLLSWLEARL
jgi:hypothetical protein